MTPIVGLIFVSIFWLTINFTSTTSDLCSFEVDVSIHVCDVAPKDWQSRANALITFLKGHNLTLNDINNCAMDTIEDVYPRDKYVLNQMSLPELVKFYCSDAVPDMAWCNCMTQRGFLAISTARTCAIPHKYPKGIQADFRPLLKVLDACQRPSCDGLNDL